MVRQGQQGVNAAAGAKIFKRFSCGANSTQAFFIEEDSGAEAPRGYGERTTMKLLRTWDTIETSWKSLLCRRRWRRSRTGWRVTRKRCWPAPWWS